MTHGTPIPTDPAARLRTIEDARGHFLALWAADQLMDRGVDRLAADLTATPDNASVIPDLIRTRRLDD